MINSNKLDVIDIITKVTYKHYYTNMSLYTVRQQLSDDIRTKCLSTISKTDMLLLNKLYDLIVEEYKINSTAIRGYFGVSKTLKLESLIAKKRQT